MTEKDYNICVWIAHNDCGNVSVCVCVLLLFEEECRSALDPCVMISCTRQLHVCHHTQTLGAAVHGQRDALVWRITSHSALKHTHSLYNLQPTLETSKKCNYYTALWNTSF